jgi:methionyl aminopeptidase
MITIKTPEEIEILRESGKRLAAILREVASNVRPGITTFELDAIAQEMIASGHDESPFLNYQPEFHKKPFPAALCVSVNEEVVHGIPGPRVLLEGDVVTVDLGLKHNKMITDHAVTVIVGVETDESLSPVNSNKTHSRVSLQDKIRLVNDTKEALMIGIKQVKNGARVGDVGNAIEQFVNKRYGIIRELAGHGVGYAVHEDPYVPNYGKKGTGPVLKTGMVIAIEPMLTLGKEGIITKMDGYTICTRDKSLAAHWEHTVVVTDDGCEILTK